MDFVPSDLVTIALLVALEGLLSADNAMVLAVLVLGLPKAQQKKALRYGIVGAFFFRTIATLLAVYLIQVGWATLVKVELTDIVFAIDSILVAVAMSPKRWVVITGGLLGIVAMRLVIGKLLAIVRRYPALVDGAFVIIAWVGIKLFIEYLHAIGVLHVEVPRWLSLGLIVIIFTAAFVYARRQGAVPDDPDAGDDAATLLARDEQERG